MNPRARDNLEIGSPDQSTGRIVVRNPATNQYFQLHPGAVWILQHADGTRSVQALAESLGRPNESEIQRLERIVGDLARNGLVWIDGIDGRAPDRDATQREPAPAGRERFAVRWPADSWLSARPWLWTWLPSPITLASLAGVLAAACLVLVVNYDDFRTLLSQRPPVGHLAWLLPSVLAAIVLHEFAHAAVLKALGGRVHSVGLKFQYLVPTLAVDTRDTYLLESRVQRAMVPLAGPVLHLVLAAISFLSAQVVLGISTASGSTAALLSQFAAINLVLAAVNLLPLANQDGYWALSTLVGVANLRGKATEWALAVPGRLIGRGTLAPKPSRPVLLAVYGYIWLLVAAVLPLVAILLYWRLATRLGSVGAVLLGTAAVVWIAGRIRVFVSRDRRKEDDHPMASPNADERTNYLVLIIALGVVGLVLLGVMIDRGIGSGIGALALAVLVCCLVIAALMVRRLRRT